MRDLFQGDARRAALGLVDRAEIAAQAEMKAVCAIVTRNTDNVLRAFQAEQVAARHFAPTTGYGYDDVARDTLERVFARVMGAQDALVRPQIASGTHALALCLFGLLRPGDVLLSVAGSPYDTLEEVIGLGEQSGQGSLREFGIGYRQIDLLDDGTLDHMAIEKAAANPSVRVVWVQRSRGYAWRPSLTLADIQAVSDCAHRVNPRALVVVDNCYGEFTQIQEPLAVGADLMAGSLIKNPGGGIAPTGGYVAGKKELVERVACRLTSPGIGREVGSYAGSYAAFYQGLFLAPHVVGEAVKTAILAAHTFALAGYDVLPAPGSGLRDDIIQAVRLEKSEAVIAFCRGIQAASPVDGHVVPEPWDMPGYTSRVIMAAGTFVQGASIELSADAPIRPPYIAYLQGGLTYEHGKLGVISALEVLLREGLCQGIPI